MKGLIQQAKGPEVEILVKNYKRYEKNTLQAFVDLEIVEIGLTIKDATFHQSAWIELPGRGYTETGGKRQWADILEFSKERGAEFKSGAIKAIKEYVVAEKQPEAAPIPEPEQSEIPYAFGKLVATEVTDSRIRKDNEKSLEKTF